MPMLLQNVQAAGYETPTPIQQATIPLVMSGRDVLGCAQTGTGKTAAFALPIIQQIAKKPTRFGQPRTIRTLILTPTRELAQQIYDNFVLYGKRLPVFPAVVFGGVNQQGQVNALNRGADVVIACPGRLWDLMNQGFVHLEHVETFVLDEADRMLDMGFIHDVRRIAEKLPQKRQTLMFSATMPEEVEKLAMDLLHEPESVKVDPVSSTVKKIDQCLYYVDKANKKYLLAQILCAPDVENALVFSRTRHGAERIVRELKRAGIDAAAIHGDKSQNARQAALNAFKAGTCKVLVATDIAARGIDIAGLSHVINYDLPMEPEAYVHRIGRTGRAGRDGTAISFCCIDEVKQLEQVEKLIGKRLPRKESDWPMEITTPSEPKARMPVRPAKLTMQGNAAPERKAVKAVNTKHPVQPVRDKAPIREVPERPVRQGKTVRTTKRENPAARENPAKQGTQAKRENQTKRETQTKSVQQMVTPRFGPAAPSRNPKGGQPVMIGRDGKVRLGGAPIRVQSAPASKPISHQAAKKGTGKPVHRVNRARGRNGER